MINEKDIKEEFMWHIYNTLERNKRGFLTDTEMSITMKTLQHFLHSMFILCDESKDLEGEYEHLPIEGCVYDKSFSYRNIIVNVYFDDYGQQDYYTFNFNNKDYNFSGGSYNFGAARDVCFYIDDIMLEQLINKEIDFDTFHK